MPGVLPVCLVCLSAQGPLSLSAQPLLSLSYLRNRGPGTSPHPWARPPRPDTRSRSRHTPPMRGGKHPNAAHAPPPLCTGAGGACRMNRTAALKKQKNDPRFGGFMKDERGLHPRARGASQPPGKRARRKGDEEGRVHATPRRRRCAVKSRAREKGREERAPPPPSPWDTRCGSGTHGRRHRTDVTARVTVWRRSRGEGKCTLRCGTSAAHDRRWPRHTNA